MITFLTIYSTPLHINGDRVACCEKEILLQWLIDPVTTRKVEPDTSEDHCSRKKGATLLVSH